MTPRVLLFILADMADRSRTPVPCPFAEADTLVSQGLLERRPVFDRPDVRAYYPTPAGWVLWYASKGSPAPANT